MKEIARIRTAKLVYALAGWLAPIKTYQRTYEWTGSFDEQNDDDVIWEPKEWEYVGRAWLPCRASLRLLAWSQQLDTVHFNHWALEHLPGEQCTGTECRTCGGFAHTNTIGDLNEEVVVS